MTTHVRFSIVGYLADAGSDLEHLLVTIVTSNQDRIFFYITIKVVHITRCQSLLLRCSVFLIIEAVLV